MSIALPGYVPDVHSSDALDPAWGNAIRDRAPQVFTTAALRDAAITVPQVGQTCILTAAVAGIDTGIYVYAGATDLWVRPWNLPWGSPTNGLASITTTQATITAEADVTSLTLTNTYVANRRLRITVNLIVTKNTTGLWSVYVSDGTTSHLVGSNNTADSVKVTHTATFIVPSTSAGSVLYKVRARGSATAGSIDATASVTDPWRIAIEDIGPAGAPS